jgi:hypothetical protein
MDEACAEGLFGDIQGRAEGGGHALWGGGHALWGSMFINILFLREEGGLGGVVFGGTLVLVRYVNNILDILVPQER